MLNDFKAFIMRGNVLDLAVAVIIGGAFGKIVSSLVDDIIMPLIGLIIGGINFTGLIFTVGNAKVTYGNFIQNIVDFLIIAIVILVLFGGRKIPEVMKGLGQGVREFKEGMRGDQPPAQASQPAAPPATNAPASTPVEEKK